MTDYFLRSTQVKGSKYLKDIGEIEQELKKSGIKTVLWTVTYGAMDIIEAQVNLHHPNLIFIETGGSKGKRDVLPREELHRMLQLLAPDGLITSEYGMCELSHQAYFLSGSFRSTEALWPIVTDIQDPFFMLPIGSRGRLCWIDFGNTHSCPFIETEDMAILKGERSVTIEGRLDHAELRGCNLMYS